MFDKKTFGALALALLVGCSSGGEKKSGETPRAEGDKPKVERKAIDASAVPAPVTAGLAKEFPAAKANSWMQRGDVYSAKCSNNGHWLDVKLSKDGTLTESAEQVTADAMPDPVKTAFAASPYAKMVVVDGEKRVKTGEKGDTLYKYVLKDGDAGKVAVYKPDGSFVKDKPFPKEKLPSGL